MRQRTCSMGTGLRRMLQATWQGKRADHHKLCNCNKQIFEPLRRGTARPRQALPVGPLSVQSEFVQAHTCAYRTTRLCSGGARTNMAGRVDEVEQVVVAAMPVHQRRCLRLCEEHALQRAARRWNGRMARSECALGNIHTVQAFLPSKHCPTPCRSRHVLTRSTS